MNRPRYPRLCAAIVFLLAGLSFVSNAVRAQEANPFKPPRATVHTPRVRDYHVRHLRLILELDVPSHAAHGDVTNYLTPLRDSLKTVVLDAGPNLKIEHCRINGADVPFTHEKDKLNLTPSAPLPGGKEAAVEIRYTMPGGQTAGGANGLGGWHWIDADPGNPDRRPGFWTQGETETNRNWVPCYDFPNDKCTSETIVTAPENWEIIGNGIQGETISDAAKHTRTFHWTMKQPHSTYLLSLVGGELDVVKSVWAGVPLYYVGPKGEGDLLTPSLQHTPDMLQFFSDILGFKYPWPKYAENMMIDFGGGMENVSATTMGARSLVDDRSEKWGIYSLTSHELAHQWFGDTVTCKDWGDVWLNEGFATFFEMLYMEHKGGKDRYDTERANALQAYLGEAQRYKRPVSTNLYPNGDRMFDSHTYPKGGLILHMLRRELGDAAFFKGLGHYLNKNRYKPVDTHDLVQAMSESVGHSVAPFFNQWIFKPGHPVLEWNWSYSAPEKAVVVHVKQVQDTSDGTPIYTMPLTLALLRDTPGSAVQRQRVTITKADQEFRLPAAGRPGAVLLDPDHDLLKEIKNVQWADGELPVILRYAPSVLDRKAATTRYAQAGAGLDDAKIETLVEAFKADTSEDNGANIIQLLGNTTKESLRDLFREQVHSPQVERRVAAVNALAKLPANDEDTGLIQEEAVSDTEPYRVVLDAMDLLSKDVAGNLAVFRHQASVHSLRDQLAGAAVTDLAAAKLDAAAPALIEATAPIHTINVRMNAVNALGKIAPDNDTIHATLIGLLQDSSPRLQQEAIQALKERKDKQAVTALRDLATTSKNTDVQTAAKNAADAIESNR